MAVPLPFQNGETVIPIEEAAAKQNGAWFAGQALSTPRINRKPRTRKGPSKRGKTKARREE